ncbi:TIR domain-containing protein [Methylomonas sp. 11b]|uniref:TIR domain-containing protein n=1 Tax=Methylomonas sp. 11b TaxID=1168169 RepID=UPI00047D69C0|nr:nucleotide-binding protein [Methylomonas sp. 11b]OQW66772.1 MAG: hypothetical protein BVN35_21235 [Proteobacteria bacterium ST_bin11]
MKPRVFIGSSVESLPFARAIQSEVAYDFEVTIWSQGIFKLSNSSLEDLENALNEFDCGIFVFSPDDVLKIRNRRHKAVRDNVIFEFGLFVGKLGKDRVYFLIPEDSGELHLPSDLLGIKPGTYFNRSDGNLRAAVAPFCYEVREKIRDLDLRSTGLSKAGMFQDFMGAFQTLLAMSSELALFFIHSRSWRENNHDLILGFLERKESKRLYIFLPNFLNDALMRQLAYNFDDGRYILGLVEDAVNFFLNIQKKYPRKVVLRLYDFYPTYSFYKFDNSAIVAFYPTTDKKKNVPTFEFQKESSFWNFLNDDFETLVSKTIPLSSEHTEKLLENNNA